jgi:F-box protein 1 (cyclin F)
MERAAAAGSVNGAFDLWEMKRETCYDPSSSLQSVRWLRELATCGCLEAQIELCVWYGKGQTGGLPRDQALLSISQLLASRKPSCMWHALKSQADLNENMRYILFDWLCEVAEMKLLSSVVLHSAMECVDRYLSCRSLPRSKLQLLGVTCMVLSARFLGRDIITIREAAWLTDATYAYEDVVRMMGEVLGATGGNLQVITIADYLRILTSVAHANDQVHMHACYLGELAMLHAHFTDFPPGLVALSCMLLSLVTLHLHQYPSSEIIDDFHISQALVNCCPFPQQMWWNCTGQILNKCLLEEAIRDHRNMPLKAVFDRYGDSRFLSVSSVPVITVDQLAMSLGCDPLVLLADDDTTEYIHNGSFVSSSEYATPVKSNNSESLLTENFDIDRTALVKSEAHFHKDNNGMLNNDSHTCSVPLECGSSSMSAMNELTPETEAEADLKDSDKCLGRQPLLAIGNLQVDGQRDDCDGCSRTSGCTWQL